MNKPNKAPVAAQNDVKGNNPIDVPFIVYEASQSRLERIIKRLWITTIILIILLVGSNIAWLIYESQFEYYEETVTQEAENNDGDIIMNGTGDLTINGQSEANHNK